MVHKVVVRMHRVSQTVLSGYEESCHPCQVDIVSINLLKAEFPCRTNWLLIGAREQSSCDLDKTLQFPMTTSKLQFALIVLS